MMTTISILGFGLLFALFGVLQLRQPRCSGNCGACSNGCDAGNAQEEP